MPLSAVRREAIELLCAAQADGRISVDLFETRLAAVQQAASDAAIEAIVADLRDPDPAADYALEPVPADPPPVPFAEQLRLSAVLGTTRREGNWVVPYQLEALTVLGEMILDFRDAYLPENVIDLDVSVTLGSVVVIVPKGTEVQDEVHSILSSVERKRKGKSFVPPNGLVLRLTGTAVLASVEVRER